MATIRRRGDKWQVMIRKQGVKPISKTFTYLHDAETWAKMVESEIERGLYVEPGNSEKITLSDLSNRYAEEVLPLQRSVLPTKSIIKTLNKSLGSLTIKNLTPEIIAKFRNDRLKLVKSSYVSRELSVLNRILNVAAREWGITLPKGNPLQSVKNPKKIPGRERRLEPEEEIKLLEALENRPVIKLRKNRQGSSPVNTVKMGEDAIDTGKRGSSSLRSPASFSAISGPSAVHSPKSKY